MTVEIDPIDLEAATALDDAASYIEQRAPADSVAMPGWFWQALAWVTDGEPYHRAVTAMADVLATFGWLGHCSIATGCEAMRAAACYLRGEDWAYDRFGNPVRRLTPEDRPDGEPEPGADDDQPWLDASDEHDYAEERQS